MIRSSKASTRWVMLVVMEMACLISFIELEMTDKLSGSWFGLRSVSSTATYCWPSDTLDYLCSDGSALL